MTEAKAKILAAALLGNVVTTMPQSRMHGVALTRPDGKYALIEEDAGAVYFDEHACWVGYPTLGDDPKGCVEAQEWINWDGSEPWARGLSVLLESPEYWHSGGGIWVVLFTRSDGRFAVIGAEGADIYQSKEHWEQYFEAGQPEPEYLNWT
jgi:hypothetical protein